MPKRAIYQRKVDGKWAVIELPDDYKDFRCGAQRISGLTLNEIVAFGHPGG